MQFYARRLRPVCSVPAQREQSHLSAGTGGARGTALQSHNMKVHRELQCRDTYACSTRRSIGEALPKAVQRSDGHPCCITLAVSQAPPEADERRHDDLIKRDKALFIHHGSQTRRVRPSPLLASGTPVCCVCGSLLLLHPHRAEAGLRWALFQRRTRSIVLAPARRLAPSPARPQGRPQWLTGSCVGGGAGLGRPPTTSLCNFLSRTILNRILF